jgi:Mrp family chromosome partitioning ATPase
MSKNFELLQQIGNDDELLRTTPLSNDAVVAAVAEPGSPLDQDTFERLMEKISLSDILQTSNEPPHETLIACSEFVSGPAVESSSRRPSSDASKRTLPTPGIPTSPIGELRKNVENRARQSSARRVSLPETLHAGGKPKESRGTVSQEPLPGAKTTTQKKVSQRPRLSFSWLDSIKSSARGWEWKAPARNNHRGADLEAITREEEIKLVQRVFPGTPLNSPRVALFACLEDEAGCASTCIRAAEILAARGEGPVCLVDANFQTPSLHEYFGVGNVKGLAEATLESGPILNFAQQIPEPDLWLIPSGKADARLRFSTMADGLRLRIEELRDTFKYVVIHSGPLRLETSSMLLSRWTDGVVLVLEAHSTTRDAARRVKEILDAAGVSLLGAVLNNRTFPIPEAIYRRL